MVCFAKSGLTGLAYSAKARIFNNILYMRYVQLTRQSIFIRGKPILSLERMLHKDYDRKGSVETKISRR
jgi:hypothetical protein